ncbi:DUF421 domain-containing protein [Mycobacterium branderi]|uniref:DUF421 domain-containing protein n=1 Tax=Mycobacterium branderi TaxID=43348 RepID=A0A7I7WCX1_9MYCO|nr:YetF domain-containing protein [Mycobacterium branderi]MCV7236415.1 DUF421 domain-containing protein [Mycobacterium branderi]ORA32587.1 DUF421 domain-containing protein [Mycobacterium branderi]BBZ15304.1 hypothetical protein MBRA_54990 [Mycobacterium branderi]
MRELLLQLFDGWRPAGYAALKALAFFVTAAGAFRFTLRRTIAALTPFDWVTAVAIGAVIGRTATAADTSWFTGAAALLTLVAAHDVVARLRFIPWMRRVVDKPVRVLIRDGQLHEPNMKRCGLTRVDLDAILREHGHQTPENVRLALFESKGAVSIMSKSQDSGNSS